MAYRHPLQRAVLYALMACQVPPATALNATRATDLERRRTWSDPSDVPRDRPLRLLFLGNSFTHQGDVPRLVARLAGSAGFPMPRTVCHAPAGRDLAHHRSDPGSLARIDRGGWDVVVLQDYSTRPTDAGDPLAFRADVAWLHERIHDASPDATVVLYETWARHELHEVYPDLFADPEAMQAQLRRHYAAAAAPADIRMAPVGDAWEAHLAEASPLVLHGADLYHANPEGRALSAMVLYATIYEAAATGTAALGLPEARAARLQATADRTISRRQGRGGRSPR